MKALTMRLVLMMLLLISLLPYVFAQETEEGFGDVGSIFKTPGIEETEPQYDGAYFITTNEEGIQQVIHTKYDSSRKVYVWYDATTKEIKPLRTSSDEGAVKANVKRTKFTRISSEEYKKGMTSSGFAFSQVTDTAVVSEVDDHREFIDGFDEESKTLVVSGGTDTESSEVSIPEPVGVPTEATEFGGEEFVVTTESTGDTATLSGGPVVSAKKPSYYMHLDGKGHWWVREGKGDLQFKNEKGEVVNTVQADTLQKISDAQLEFLKSNPKAPIVWSTPPDPTKPGSGVLEARITELTGDARKESGRVLITRSDESYREKIYREGTITSDVETFFDQKSSGASDDVRIIKTYYDPAGKITSSITYRRYIVNSNGVILGQSGEPLTAVLPSGAVLDYASGKINGKEISDKDIERLSKEDKEFYAEIKNLHKNYVYREILDSLRFYGTEYSGIAAFSSLFISEEFLQSWQKIIEDTFCKTILLGGSDCWTSKICKSYDDSISRNGVLLIASDYGSSVPVAHVEAERSLPAVFQNGSAQNTEFLYKITYYVRNPENHDDLHYNLVFLPRGYQAFSQEKVLKPGQVDSAAGQLSIVKYSSQLYTKICLVFDKELTDAQGIRVSKVCNDICGGVINPESGRCNPLETTIEKSQLTTSTTPIRGTEDKDFQNF